METAGKLAGFAVCAALVALILRHLRPEAGWGVSLGAGAIVLLAAFLCYVFCCAISVCAVVWVLLSEMYPIRVRGVAMSIAGFSLWTGTYLVGQLTPWMLANLTPAGTFFPLRRDVRALYAADMEGGAGDVGPHARRDRTILDKVTI